MKKYRIYITSKALENMEGIYNYIALDLQAPGSAIKQYNRIADAILTLEELPERSELPPLTTSTLKWGLPVF